MSLTNDVLLADGGCKASPQDKKLQLVEEFVVEQTQTSSAINEIPDGGVEAWLVVLGGFVLAFSTFGYFVSWGIYQAYYETVLLTHNSSQQIAWIGSLQYSLIFLPGLIAGRLFDLGFFKSTLICASTIMTMGNFLTAECTKYWQFLLCQGLLLGLSSSCIYIPCISVVSHWFKNRKPLAFAIITFGASLGGIIYPIIIRNLLPAVGFKWTIRTIGFINVAAFTIAILTMRSRIPPPEVLPKLFDIRTFASPAYMLYVAATFVTFLGLYTPLTFFSVNAEMYGITPSFAFYLVSISNGASAIGRLASGPIAQYYGAVNVLVVSTAAAAVFTYAWPFVTTKGALIAIAILYGITSGVFICLFAIPVAQLGSVHDVGRRTGMQMTVMAIGALAGPPISGAIKMHHNTFREVGIYAGTVVAASILLMLASKYCVMGSVFTGKF